MGEKICYTIGGCVRYVTAFCSHRKAEYAPVAQLDRALDSDSKGRWFESSRAYQKFPCLLIGKFLLFGYILPI